MKGIILAGGQGTRLHPLTISMSKQLLPIYDKPMIYYPLSVLMLSGIKEVLIISTPRDLPRYEELLGNGSNIGMHFEYKVQPSPKGLAEAFILAEDFIGKESVCLILGDNIFYGQGLTSILEEATKLKTGGIIFGYRVADPKEFGVVEYGTNGNVISIEEKPKKPKSNYAIPGLYFFDNKVIEYAKTVQPSERGELEITSVMNEYLKRGDLKALLMRRGIAWLDTGNPSSMLEASTFVKTVQERQGLYVACIEEIAYRKGLISSSQLLDLGTKLKKTNYGKYLINVAKETI